MKEFKVDIVTKIGFAIPCDDESTFQDIASDNGKFADTFDTNDGWQGRYIELANSYIVYYYSDDYAYIVDKKELEAA